MPIKTFDYKMPSSRKLERFAVVPFSKGSNLIKLQSSHRCVILDLHKGTMSISPWIKRAPMYIDCIPAMGGTVYQIPKDLRLIIQSIPPKPTNYSTPRRNGEKYATC